MGITQEQCSNFGWGNVLHPDDAERTIAAWKECVRTAGTWDIEHRFRGVDGQWHPILARGVPVKDETGKIICWAGINLDISRIKQAEEELRQTVEELARSNKDLEQFAYVASHDLQEPLRMVIGFLGLLRDRYQGKLDEKADRYITLAVDGANRMSQLIVDLLEYSRAGTRGLDLKPTSCAYALETAIVHLQSGIDEQRARITHDPLPTVVADAGQLTRLFQNLIGNALKFRRDDLPPEIHIGARRDGNCWVLSVKDNGIGIPQDQFVRIFGVFQRLHGREKYPGTGIGLAICKKILERHGGKIWVESELGLGTTLFFTIPAGEGSAHD